MSIPPKVSCKVLKHILHYLILLSCFPGFILSAVVTLSSMEIFKTHEWLNSKPTVYFRCKEENKTVLPDVKEIHVMYTFKSEESWQPLTEFSIKKCKRCGFYEEDILKSDVFDEWEFCPSDFIVPDGIYNRLVENEFNATFSCPECITSFGGASVSESHDHTAGKSIPIAIVVPLVLVISTVVILGVVTMYKFWKKKKRQQEQARFLKLFEEGDDIEDELGLGTVV